MRITWIIGFAFLTVLFGCGTNKKTDQIRVMSFNIKAGSEDLDETVRVIREQNPDIIALQEVDVHWSERSNFVNQAEYVAEALGMHSFFGEIYSIPSDEQDAPPRQYGLALMSKEPFLDKKNHSISRLSTQAESSEPELMPGFPEIVVKSGKINMHVFNTHLDYRKDPAVRDMQVKEMLKIMDLNKPVILMGDFNARPNAEEFQSLFEKLNDVWEQKNAPGYTFPSNQPDRRIDYILHSDHFEVSNVFVVHTEASDHLPVVADLILKSRQ